MDESLRVLGNGMGGGRLVGMGKDGKPLDEDARPLVVGEVWRRLAAKVTVKTSKAKILTLLSTCSQIKLQ